MAATTPPSPLSRVVAGELARGALAIAGFKVPTREFASARNVSGVRSKTQTFSSRHDSRTLFATDSRYGYGAKAGAWVGTTRPSSPRVDACSRVAKVPSREVATVDVVVEMGQVAERASEQRFRVHDCANTSQARACATGRRRDSRMVVLRDRGTDARRRHRIARAALARASRRCRDRGDGARDAGETARLPAAGRRGRAARDSRGRHHSFSRDRLFHGCRTRDTGDLFKRQSRIANALHYGIGDERRDNGLREALASHREGAFVATSVLYLEERARHNQLDEIGAEFRVLEKERPQLLLRKHSNLHVRFANHGGRTTALRRK